MSIDLRKFQTHLLARGFNARAKAPTRGEISRARLRRDLYRGRPRRPNATSTPVSTVSSYDGQTYTVYSNGRIEHATAWPKI